MMVSQTVMMENAATSSSQRHVQIRKKIKDVFGWECMMNDDALVKCYSITIDGELVMILR
jgi:phosphoribosylpyrophosphate synthetase